MNTQSKRPVVSPSVSVAAAPQRDSLFYGLPKTLRAKLAAIAPEQLRTVNAELVEHAAIILATLPTLRTLRPQFERMLPEFDLAAFDALEDLCHAGEAVQVAWQAYGREEDEVPALIAEAEPMRAELLSECAPLARRGAISRDQFEALSLGNGHRDTALFLLTAVKMVERAWEQIGGRTGITPELLERAEAQGTKILAALVKREERDVTLAQRALERQQMFTLLVASYAEARRAVEYVRFHEGDADTFAPSLYAKRGMTRHKTKADDSEQGDAKAADAKSADTKAADAKSADAKSADAKASKTRPEDVVPLAGNGLPLVPQDDWRA